MSCATGSYSDGPAGPYGPGDRICYRLRVDFPGALDTGTPTVTDFLPPGTEYESYTETVASNVVIQDFDGDPGPALTWTLGEDDGDGNDATNGQVFEVLLAVRVVDPTAGQSDDVKGNLMKFSHANSGGAELPAARPGRVHLGGAAAHAHRGRPRHREPARRRQRPGRGRRHRPERRRGDDPRRRDQPGRSRRAERDRLGAPAHGARQPDDRLPRRVEHLARRPLQRRRHPLARHRAGRRREPYVHVRLRRAGQPAPADHVQPPRGRAQLPERRQHERHVHVPSRRATSTPQSRPRWRTPRRPTTRRSSPPRARRSR